MLVGENRNNHIALQIPGLAAGSASARGTGLAIAAVAKMAARKI